MMKEELLQAIEVGEPVLLVTAIGYIVGIVETKGELKRCVYQLCFSQ